MHNWKTSKRTKAMGITPDDLRWIKENKDKKSAAGFLEYLINKFKNNGK